MFLHHRWCSTRDLFHWRHWHPHVLRHQETYSPGRQDSEAWLCGRNIYCAPRPVCPSVPWIHWENYWIDRILRPRRNEIPSEWKPIWHQRFCRLTPTIGMEIHFWRAFVLTRFCSDVFSLGRFITPHKLQCYSIDCFNIITVIILAESV